MENIKLDRFIEQGYTIRMSTNAYADGDLDLKSGQTIADIPYTGMTRVEYEVNYDNGYRTFTVYDSMNKEIDHFGDPDTSERELLEFLVEFVKELENSVDDNKHEDNNLMNFTELVDSSLLNSNNKMKNLTFKIEDIVTTLKRVDMWNLELSNLFLATKLVSYLEVFFDLNIVSMEEIREYLTFHLNIDLLDLYDIIDITKEL